MVNPVNNITYVSGSNNRPVTLIPPSQLYPPAYPVAYPPSGHTSPSHPPYGNDDLSVVGKTISEASQFGVGALTGYKYHGTIADASKSIAGSFKTGSFKEIVGSLKTNGKIMGTAGVNAAGIGALVSGGISLVSNTVSLAQGNDNLGGAVSNIITDSIKGALSGVGGVAVGGISSLTLSAFKVTGTPLVIAGVVGGAVGAALVNQFIDTDGIRASLRRKLA